MNCNYIIATRNPRTKKLVLVMNEDGTTAEFENEHDAMRVASNTTICEAWGYELIEVGKP